MSHPFQHDTPLLAGAPSLPPFPRFEDYSAACVAAGHRDRCAGTPAHPMCAICMDAYTTAFRAYKRAERQRRRTTQPRCQFCARAGKIPLADGAQVCVDHAELAVLPATHTRQALLLSGRALVTAAEGGTSIGLELFSWAMLAKEAGDTERLISLFLVLIGSCYRALEDGEADRWLAAGRALQAALHDERFGAVVERAAYDVETIRAEPELIGWGKQRLLALRGRGDEDAALETLDLRVALGAVSTLNRRSPRWIDALRIVRGWRDDHASRMALVGVHSQYE